MNRYVFAPTAAEREDLWTLAQARHQPKAVRGIAALDWQPLDGRTVLRKHYEGLLGEWAVATLLGAELDRRISLRGNGRRANLRLPDGRGVDVRYRGRRGWSFGLRGTAMRDFGGDLGVLVWPSLLSGPDAVEVMGWLRRSEFEALAVVEDYGHGARLVVALQQMRSMDELVGAAPADTGTKEVPTEAGHERISRPPGATQPSLF